MLEIFVGVDFDDAEFAARCANFVMRIADRREAKLPVLFGFGCEALRLASDRENFATRSVDSI
jgi:hypothetical protein